MSTFTLEINTDKASISNRYEETAPSEAAMEKNRREGVACLLRVVALMLEDGRDVEKIRDHLGSVCGRYELRQV